MRDLVSRLHLIVAIVVTMLAAGNGLPGIERALGDAAAHVCTCANGGDHASCPVCNPTLLEHRRSSHPVADGVPCGSRRLATTASSDVTTLPSPLVGVVSRIERGPAPRSRRLFVEQAFLEPAIPPPRSARA